MFFKKWNHSVIENISRGDGMLAFIQLRKTNTGIGINKSLLINAADTFDITT